MPQIDDWLQDNYRSVCEERGLTPGELADVLAADDNPGNDPIIAWLRSLEPAKDATAARKAVRATSKKQTATTDERS